MDTREAFTYSPQDGENGHCFSAQVWDAEGNNVAIVDGKSAQEATARAKFIAEAFNAALPQQPSLPQCNPPETCVTLADYNTMENERDYHMAMEQSLFERVTALESMLSLTQGMTESQVEALEIITRKLNAAKKSPVILSWDDAGTIKIALSALPGNSVKGAWEPVAPKYKCAACRDTGKIKWRDYSNGQGLDIDHIDDCEKCSPASTDTAKGEE